MWSLCTPTAGCVLTEVKADVRILGGGWKSVHCWEYSVELKPWRALIIALRTEDQNYNTLDNSSPRYVP